MNIALPQAVKACLWSYDTDRMDMSVPDHKQRIIENVLNRGTGPAVHWLLHTVSRAEIAQAIEHTSVSVWDKKSLSLWSLVFNARPARSGRFTLEPVNK